MFCCYGDSNAISLVTILFRRNHLGLRDEAIAIRDTEVFMDGVYKVCGKHDFVTTIGARFEKCECLVQNTLDNLGVGVSVLKQRLDLQQKLVVCVHAHKNQNQFQMEVNPTKIDDPSV